MRNRPPHVQHFKQGHQKIVADSPANIACRIFEGTLRTSIFNCCPCVKNGGDVASFAFKEHIEYNDQNMTDLDELGELQLSPPTSISTGTDDDIKRPVSTAPSVMVKNAKTFLSVTIPPLTANDSKPNIQNNAPAVPELMSNNRNTWSQQI